MDPNRSIWFHLYTVRVSLSLLQWRKKKRLLFIEQQTLSDTPWPRCWCRNMGLPLLLVCYPGLTFNFTKEKTCLNLTSKPRSPCAKHRGKSLVEPNMQHFIISCYHELGETRKWKGLRKTSIQYITCNWTNLLAVWMILVAVTQWN